MKESKEVMQGKVDAFNEKNPVGTPIVVVTDMGREVKTKVKYPAKILSGHTPVVWLEEIGCYHLDRVR